MENLLSSSRGIGGWFATERFLVRFPGPTDRSLDEEVKVSTPPAKPEGPRVHVRVFILLILSHHLLYCQFYHIICYTVNSNTSILSRGLKLCCTQVNPVNNVFILSTPELHCTFL